MPAFEHMTLLNLLWIIPLLAAGYIGYFNWQKKARQNFGDKELIQALTGGPHVNLMALKAVLKLLVLAVLIIAFARPVGKGQKSSTAINQQKDMVLVIDVSASMLATDILPDRLQLAKSTALQMVEAMNGSAVGVVVFAGNAYTYQPLTTDLEYAKRGIRAIQVDEGIRQGTSFKEPLWVADALFGAGNGNRKVICIISDGESHSENYKRTADSLRKSGVTLVCAGVGTVTGSTIPVSTKTGQIIYKKDKNGIAVITKLNERSLLAIASKKDRYIHVNSADNKIQPLLAAIKADGKKEQAISGTDVDLHSWLLGLAFVLLMVDWLMPARLKRSA